MHGKTHLVTGVALGMLVATQVNAQPGQALAAAGVAGLAALAPDWLQVSIPGLKVPNASGHRGFTHWLVTALTLSWAVQQLYPATWLPLSMFAGWSSHIALDALNKPGVPALWPLPWRVQIAKFKAGGAVDALCGILATLAALWLAIGFI